jgi:hypothetical protein
MTETTLPVELKKFIPMDKSWIIRMGILDLVNGYNDIEVFLSQQPKLNDDLLALQRAVNVWKTNEPVDVGESGTLFRLLQFASWKLGLNKQFIKHGTLPHRQINTDPNIVNWSAQELLRLDNATSQWATASVLLGNPERIANPPFKLQVTYDAVEHWKKQREKNLPWEPRYDETITNQALAFLEILKGNKPEFIPEQAEDYCFARIFGYVTQTQGESNWPSLKGHESNRIEEMEKVIALAEAGQEIPSTDHRVVQAVVMWGLVNHKSIILTHPEAVNKTWPQFWDFINSDLVKNLSK